MDFLGIYERGSTPIAVFSSGAGPSVTVSKNGGAFAGSVNAPVNIAATYYMLQMDSTETDTEGPLLLRIQSGGPEVAVIMQIRALLPSIRSITDQSVINSQSSQLAATSQDILTAIASVKNKVVAGIGNKK